MSSKVQQNDRKYKDLSMKQMIRIVDKTYREYLTFYLKHERMPDEEETSTIYCKLFQLVLALTPNASLEDFEMLCQKRSSKYGNGFTQR